MTTSETQPPFYDLRPYGVGPSSFLPLELRFAIERRVDELFLTFQLAGRERPEEFGALAVPRLKAALERERRDELWKHTCLELFFGLAGSESYFELNLSPTGDWNLYGFDGYRSGMRAIEILETPRFIEVEDREGGRRWQARLKLRSKGGELDRLIGSALESGATAVLEYCDGRREYWALAHCGEKPDFHLRQSFCLILS